MLNSAYADEKPVINHDGYLKLYLEYRREKDDSAFCCFIHERYDSRNTIAKQAQIGVTGKPFNVASYALLTMMVAQVCDLEVGDFVHTLGDAHIYSNHFDQVHSQLARTPGPLPVMKINPDVSDLFAFRFEDFVLEGYEAQPSIAAPIAV